MLLYGAVKRTHGDRQRERLKWTEKVCKCLISAGLLFLFRVSLSDPVLYHNLLIQLFAEDNREHNYVIEIAAEVVVWWT